MEEVSEETAPPVSESEPTVDKEEEKKKESEAKLHEDGVDEKEEDDGNEDEEGGDEEEDDDEEYEEEPVYKRRKVSKYVADMAEEGDEDDYVDDENENEAKEAQEAAQEYSLERRAVRVVHESEDVILKRYEERDEGGEEDSEKVNRDRDRSDKLRAFPTVTDPKLFLVRCKPGSERRSVSLLTETFLRRKDTEKSLHILSATSRTGLKGYIYIEAERQSHVLEAIFNIRSLFQNSVQLVPLQEMTDVFAVQKRDMSVTSGSWARMTQGVYRGDLCEIADVDVPQETATSRLIPRIDYAAIEKEDRFDIMKREKEIQHRRAIDTQPEKVEELAQEIDDIKKELNDMRRQSTRVGGVRPSQRFFDVDAIKDRLGKYSRHYPVRKTDRDGKERFEFKNNIYEGGYLLKSVNVRRLQTTDIFPTLDELERFHPENKDKQSMMGLPTAKVVGFRRRRAALRKGDVVRVIKGESQNLLCIVKQVREDSVIVVPKDKSLGLDTDLEFQASHLEKFFVVNDHVKVLDGVHKGQTGTIVRIVEGERKATIVPDSKDIDREIETFTDDVRLTTETLSAIDRVNRDVRRGGGAAVQFGHTFNLWDMVRLGKESMGVIVKIDRDQYVVLDNSNTVKSLRPQELGPRQKFRSTATDRFRNPISKGDIVRVIDGQFRRRQGTVIHIWRGTLFVDDNERRGKPDRLFAVRSNDVQVPGGRTRPAEAGAGYYPQSQTVATFMVQSSRFHRRGGRMQRHPLLDKRVRIVRGENKGLIGRVVQASDEMVCVELESRLDSVDVGTDFVKELFDDNRPKEPSSIDTDTSRMDGAKTPFAQHAGYATSDRFYPDSTPASKIGTPMMGIFNQPTPMNVDMRESSPYSMSGTPMADISSPGVYRGDIDYAGYTQDMDAFQRTQSDYTQDVQDVEYDQLMDVEVEIVGGPSMPGEVGVVRAIDNDMVTVETRNGARVNVALPDIEVSKPRKGKVKILGGPHRGKIATCNSISEDNVIVEFEDGESTMLNGKICGCYVPR